MLTEGGSDASTFIDMGGIGFLVRFMETLSKNPNPEYVHASYLLISFTDLRSSSSAVTLILEGLNCMRALVEIGLKSVLTTLDAISVVVLHITSTSEMVVMSVLDFMREILDVTHIGYRYVNSKAFCVILINVVISE